MSTQRARALFAASLGNFLGYSCIVVVGGTGLLLLNAMSCDSKTCDPNTTEAEAWGSSYEENKITSLELGWLVGAPLLSGSLLRIPCTVLGDRVGHKKVMMALLSASLLGAILLTSYTWTRFPWPGRVDGLRLNRDSYPVLYIAALLIGCGAAVYSVGLPHISFWFPRSKQGWAVGIYGGVGNTAPGVFHLLLAGFLSRWEAPAAYLGLTVVLFIGLVCFSIVARDSWYYQHLRAGHSKAEAVELAKADGQELFPSGNFKTLMNGAVRNLHSWFLGILFMCSFGGFIALAAWFPTYWKKVFLSDVTLGDENTETAPLLIDAAFILLGGLSRVLTGLASDHVSPYTLLALGLSVQTVSLLALLLAKVFPLALTASLCAAVGFGITMAATFRLLPMLVPQSISFSVGIVATCGSIGGFFFPPMIAGFSDAFGLAGYRHGFSVVFGFTGLGVLAYFGLYCKRPRPPADAPTLEAPPSSAELKDQPTPVDSSDYSLEEFSSIKPVPL